MNLPRLLSRQRHRTNWTKSPFVRPKPSKGQAPHGHHILHCTVLSSHSWHLQVHAPWSTKVCTYEHSPLAIRRRRVAVSGYRLKSWTVACVKVWKQRATTVGVDKNLSTHDTTQTNPAIEDLDPSCGVLCTRALCRESIHSVAAAERKAVFVLRFSFLRGLVFLS